MSDDPKLYHVVVNLEFTMAIMADSAHAAEEFARENFQDELEGVRPSAHASANEMQKSDVSNYDYAGTLPHNTPNRRKTVEQYFEEE